jgi:hypothetical protein
MNDIYKHKAKKYKYKYLKLKNKLEGGVWIVDNFRSEKTIIEKIIKKLNTLKTRSLNIKKYYEIDKISGSLNAIKSLNAKKNFYDLNNIIIFYARIKTASTDDLNKFPKILTYFFNIPEKWNQKNKNFDNAKFEYIDRENLKKEFPINKYPYYKDLIDKLDKHPALVDTRHLKFFDPNAWTNIPPPFKFKVFYEKYISPIAKNIDIYMIIMTIKELFDRYANKLKNNFEASYKLVEKLVKNAYYNKIVLDSEFIPNKTYLLIEKQKIDDRISRNREKTHASDFIRQAKIIELIKNIDEKVYEDFSILIVSIEEIINSLKK